MNKSWEYRRIGDVCVVERGGSPRPIDKFVTDDEDGINWIKIGDTSDSMYITKTAQRIIPEGMKKSRYVKPGDFLLSNSMSFGRPYILKIDGCIHDGWLVLRDKDELFDKRFLYYYLSAKTTYEKFKSMAVGGVVNNLNSEMVRKVEVPIPSKTKQIQIADLLDKLKNVLDSRKQELRLLENLMKARFVEMFGDAIQNPKGWDMSLIEDVVANEKNALKAGPFGSALKKEYYVESGYKIYGQEQVISGDHTFGNYYIDEERYKLLENCAVQAGDVLISLVGTYGKLLIMPEVFEPGIINPRLMKITFDKEKVNPYYFKFFFQSESLKKALSENTHGGTMDILNLGIVRKIVMPLPPLELQNEFVSFAEQVNKSKVAVQKALDETKLLFDSLMQQYFG